MFQISTGSILKLFFVVTIEMGVTCCSSKMLICLYQPKSDKKFILSLKDSFDNIHLSTLSQFFFSFHTLDKRETVSVGRFITGSISKEIAIKKSGPSLPTLFSLILILLHWKKVYVWRMNRNSFTKNLQGWHNHKLTDVHTRVQHLLASPLHALFQIAVLRICTEQHAGSFSRPVRSPPTCPNGVPKTGNTRASAWGEAAFPSIHWRCTARYVSGAKKWMFENQLMKSLHFFA